MLGSLLAAGAGVLLPAREGLAQNRAGKIDVHYHMGQRTGPNGTKGKTRRVSWTPEGAIEEMDRGGVTVAILSSKIGRAHV